MYTGCSSVILISNSFIPFFFMHKFCMQACLLLLIFGVVLLIVIVVIVA